MDNIFLLFKNWYQKNKEDWKKKGILLINASYELTIRHSYALFFETVGLEVVMSVGMTLNL